MASVEVKLSVEGCGYMIKDLTEKAHNYIYKFKNRDERRAYLLEYNNLVESYITAAENMDSEEMKKTDINWFHLPIPIFKLAYYGENISEIGNNLVKLYKIIFKDLINNYQDILGVQYKKFDTERRDKRIRVLFISDRLGGLSSVMRDRAQIILGLCQLKKLFTVGIMTNKPSDPNGELLKKNAHLYFELKNNVFENIATISYGLWDVIIYCDLHMGQFVSTMSLIRLAPLQLTTFGHSESSFTADGFISSKWFESSEYKDFYGEKDIYLLDSLNMKYPNLINEELISKFNNREFFGFTNDQNLYLITSSLFKITYEMFYVITEILKRDNRAVVIITKMTPDYDKTFFNEMKEAINPELIGRVRFIPRLGIPDIYNLMYISDIILESFPFGNLNTTLESFEVSTPIITLPNFKLNGRFSFGLIEKMKSKNNDETLNLMIAENVEDYINKAVYIVNNKDFNLRLRESIKNNRDVLFMENKALNDWIKLLVDLTGFYEKKDD